LKRVSIGLSKLKNQNQEISKLKFHERKKI